MPITVHERLPCYVGMSMSRDLVPGASPILMILFYYSPFGVATALTHLHCICQEAGFKKNGVAPKIPQVIIVYYHILSLSLST